MRVMLDISVLGMGHHNPSSRTGIFRTAENLASGLSSARQLRLDFFYAHPPGELSWSLDYLAANPRAWSLSPLSKFSLELIRSWQYPPGAPIQGLRRTLRERDLSRLAFESAARARAELDTQILRHFTCEQAANLDRIDLFHSPFGHIPEAVRTRRTLPKVLTVHDLTPLRNPQWVSERFLNWFRQYVDGMTPEHWIICISQATKDDLCASAKVDPSKVTVNHLAASNELFYPCTDQAEIARVRAKYNIPEGPYLLALNILHPRKNMPHLIMSFASLLEAEPLTDLSLVLVGPESTGSSEIVTRLKQHPVLEKRVLRLGFVPDDELSPLYSGAMAFVYPSFAEGFGLPPLEAMQCGVPVITSNTTSLPELVGDVGMLVDPTDSDALCQAILALYRKPALRKMLGTKSILRARNFTWDAHIQHTLAVYRTALQSA